ncbi:nodulation protein NodH [Loktanella sp. D2R18]|uniref:sulfotransferase family 2 domain-containing protein n=1 Tax=Rhodobacterales TaxID=204455 RepID=UPI000DE93BB2|nr:MULTISPECIES: sulfotransferase family 2 domain-containing protein [Rhodobacterales]MDO6590395.1 sulfotransferase family 2 domain-containing protein [Yoonia sp. 1_MG-2023]RBW41123.1 nodulation protein NodH [Loktanella sp. D2R18]
MTKFDYFIILAEMRTGSNFLEANLNALEGVTCHGEAFNPAFIGYPKTDDLLGMSRDDRDADPSALITKIVADDGLVGFRFFHNHDPRALTICMDDPRCAKIILTRNPLDSYVSWKSARATGQWKLTNATNAKSLQIAFDSEEFEALLARLQEFQLDIQRRLQTSGQTAFYIGYDDLRDVEILNGLAAFLGVDARLDGLDKKMKKQNPEPLDQRVSNFDTMKAALGPLDRFDLSRTPNFEPRRGAAVPTYVASDKAGLLFMPLRSGPDWEVRRWLADVEATRPRELRRKFTQKTLRTWQETHAGYRSFTVLRHPVARAHAAFCDCILSDGPESLPGIRANLRRVHKLPIPEPLPDLTDTNTYSNTAHRAAFLGFLQFLRQNLGGQTAIRVDPAWSSQLSLLQGIATISLPDVICREDSLGDELAVLAAQVGIESMPLLGGTVHQHHNRLVAIYDGVIEDATRAAYARDYAAFGFGNWA